MWRSPALEPLRRSSTAFITMRRHLSTLIPAALIIGVAAALVCVSAEARQVAFEAVTLIFTFFTTPFILETTGIVVGLMVVLAINHRRLERETDEWVEMEVPVKPTSPSEVTKQPEKALEGR